jgi:hypothetical protein
MRNTTTGTGSGCEQAHSYEIWAHKLTNKLLDNSTFK